MDHLFLKQEIPPESLEWEVPEVVELGTVNDMTQWTGSVTVE